MNDAVRIRLSWGLVGLAILHAIFFGVFSLACHPRKPTQEPARDWSPPSYSPDPVGSVRSIQRYEDPPAVNLQAQGEIKQQAPCGPCAPSRPTYINGERVVHYGPTRTVPKVTSVQLSGTPRIVAPAVDRGDRVIYPDQSKQSPLPTPSKKSYEIALFVDGTAQSQQLQDWFDGDPQLQSLKAKCNFQVYTATNALYRTRYADIVPVDQFPVVLFQDSTGGHIHAAGRSMIPGTPEELYSDLGEGFELWKQAKQGNIQQTGAVKSKGYSWDERITPTMQLTEEDCPDGYCPVDQGWRPGDRLRPDRDGGLPFSGERVRNAFVWANSGELATMGMFVLAGILLLYILIKRGK